MAVTHGEGVGFRMSFVMVFVAWILDVLSLKGWADSLFARFATPSSGGYPVHRAVWALLDAGLVERAQTLSRDRWERSRGPRVARDYIHILLRRRDFTEAEAVAQKAAELYPDNAWLGVLHADICRFFSAPEDAERALSLYLKAEPLCAKMLPDHYPLAVLLKRVVRIYDEQGDEESLLRALERFLSLEATNFHQWEFARLSELHAKLGDRDRAKEVLEIACRAKPRDAGIRQVWVDMGFGEPPPVAKRKNPLPDMSGYGKIPVKTRLLTEADDPAETVRTYVSGDMLPGDVVAFSSCVAAIMEGRMIMEGTVNISFLAGITARIIEGRHPIGGFTSSAPMANVLSAQTAYEEVGTVRMLAAVFAGGLGKLLGRDGWFYVVAGPQVAQIDDILGSLPPYDYYVMLGPKDATRLSSRIASEIGTGVAIVDANDLGIAWAVGASPEVSRGDLERAMSDNPAGNQDQTTPIVIVRCVAERGRLEENEDAV